MAEISMMKDGGRIEEEVTEAALVVEEVAKSTIVVEEDAKTTMVEEEITRMDIEDLEMVQKVASCVIMEETARQLGEDLVV